MTTIFGLKIGYNKICVMFQFFILMLNFFCELRLVFQLAFQMGFFKQFYANKLPKIYQIKFFYVLLFTIPLTLSFLINSDFNVCRNHTSFSFHFITCFQVFILAISDFMLIFYKKYA